MSPARIIRIPAHQEVTRLPLLRPLLQCTPGQVIRVQLPLVLLSRTDLRIEERNSNVVLISGTCEMLYYVRSSTCHVQVLTSYKENCSMGSMELYVDNKSPNNSSEVVSSAITRLLYCDVGCSAEVCTRTRPPGFICKQNLKKRKEGQGS